MLKKLIITAVCVSFINIAFAQQIPSIQLTDLTGKKLNTQVFNDSTQQQPIVLAFWATWCLPCISELSTIQDDYESLQQKNAFQFFAIATDDSRTIKKVAPLVNGKGWPFSILLDVNQDFKRALNIANIPTILVLKKGKIVYKHNGFAKGDEQKLYEILATNN